MERQLFDGNKVEILEKKFKLSIDQSIDLRMDWAVGKFAIAGVYGFFYFKLNFEKKITPHFYQGRGTKGTQKIFKFRIQEIFGFFVSCSL